MNSCESPPGDLRIAAWLKLLIAPGDTFELRAPKATLPGRRKPSTLSKLFTADNLLAASHEALRYSARAPGVYFTLNPVRGDMEDGKSAADADIVCRRWLLVDCDPTRPADVSSTDDEKAAAAATAGAVLAELAARGWPDPVEADSGNGYHLLYRVDLPADDGGLVKGVLAALAERFDSPECAIDRKVFNPSRICKVYGTLTRKGEATRERPHRYARVLTVPEETAIVGEGLLRALAEELAPSTPLAESVKAPAPAPATNGKPRPDARPADRWTPEARALAYLEKVPPAVSGQNGHDATFKAAVAIGPGFDLPPDVAYRLLAQTYNPRCEPPWTERELRHKVDSAYQTEKRRGWLLEADRNGHAPAERNGAAHHRAEAPRPARPKRVEIEVTHRWHEVVEEVVKALGNDPELFRRGDMLVEVVEETDEQERLTSQTTISGLKGSRKIVALSEPTVATVITRNASLWFWKTTLKGESAPADTGPPEWLIRAVATRKHWSSVRRLLAVAECPYPRPDGSIVEKPGYDASTGTLYLPGIAFPRVPDRPTQADARAAWERLREPIRQFPFRSDDDRAVWLAGLATAVARPAIDGAVPGIAVIGNRAGTGKGLLIDQIGCIAYGRNVPTSNYPEAAEEAAKVKTALAISGKPVIHFDNIEEGGSFGNSALDSALTATSVDDRILGSSKMTGDIPLRTCWFCSGNNLTPGRDAYRRWLQCCLVTDLERPEERRDLEVKNLRAWTLEHRGELVRDVLTILRAHTLAGRPSGNWAPLGSFERWDEVIRGAVWFATGLDCVRTLREAAEASPDRLAKIALLEGWIELQRDFAGGATASKAVETATSDPGRYPTLMNAIMQFGRDGKPANARQIGNRIRGMKDSVIAGMKFVEAGDDHRSIVWKALRTDTDRPGSQGQGESVESSESSSNPSVRENF